VTELTSGFDELERDLHGALTRRVARRRRNRRTTIVALVAIASGLMSAVAIASSIGLDLQLDPTKWAILDRGGVDDGQGEFVRARDRATGEESTFMVEHDQGMDRYQAFLLHERLKGAAGAVSERGDLCTASQLTRAEVVALAALSAGFPPGTSANAAKTAVDDAVAAAFAGAPCRGLEYGGEIARGVYAGVEPRANLMPGAREA
jgi:hypothetical protein